MVNIDCSNVHHPERATATNPRDDRYSRLIVEVEDPAAALGTIGAPS
jgi:hypothetical protein